MDKKSDVSINKDNNLFISQQQNFNTISRNKLTIKDSINSEKTKNLTISAQKHYCPFCEHCNVIKDNNLDKYLVYTKEAKNIINKGFEYILNSNMIKISNEIFSEFNMDEITNNNEENSTKYKNKSTFEMEVINYSNHLDTFKLP